jgi:GTP-binding protein Era
MAEQTRAGHVAIVGRPNVGKSTLLNRLVGQRLSITARKPQTTRHRVLGIVNAAHAQCAFVDTPGFQSGRTNALGAAMNRTVTRALADVDAVVFVVVAGRYSPEDERVAALVPKQAPMIVAVNKIDHLTDRAALLPFLGDLQQRLAPRAIVPVSARQGYQVNVLLREIASLLPVRPPLYPEDQLTDRDERFFASEFLREKLFRLLGDELPYATAVLIDKFEAGPKLRRIHATVFVDKPSHKAIVLGENGERMKAIASSARKEMEALFGGKVFLQVWVKVRRGWADDVGQLHRFGYE